jgi:hypothetical protein
MHAKHCICALIATLSLLTLASETQQHTGSIAGQVRWYEDNAPASNAKIRIHQDTALRNNPANAPDPPTWTTTTDAQGFFRLENLPANQGYTVLANVEDACAMRHVQKVDTFLILDLLPGGSVSGTVLDDNGDPKENALVFSGKRKYLPGRDAPSSWEPYPILWTRANAAGEFTLGPLQEADWNIHAAAPGYAAYSSGFLQPGTRDIEARLHRDGSASGTVRYPDGTPAEGVPVIFKSQEDDRARPDDTMYLFQDLRLSGIAQTDAMGRYELHGLSEGSYRVAIQDRGLPSNEKTHLFWSQPNQHSPLPDFIVDLVPEKNLPNDTQQSIEKPDPEEGYYLQAPITLRTPERGHEELEIRLAQGASIIATVSNKNGQPIPNVSITLQSKSAAFRASGRSDMDGRFKFSVPPGDNYEISLHLQTPNVVEAKEAGKVYRAKLIQEDAGTHAVSGIALDPQGRPIHNVAVHIEGPVWSDHFGHFESSRISEANEGLFAQHPNYRCGWLQDAPAGSRNLRLVLQPRPVFSGHVIDAETREAITQFDFILANGGTVGFENSEQPQPRWHTIYHKDGFFQNSAPFSDMLSFRAEGYAVTMLNKEDFDVPNPQMELTRPAIVTGTVSGLQRKEDSGGRIFVKAYATPEPRYSDFNSYTTLNEDDGFSFAINANTKSIVVEAEDGYGELRLITPIALKPGEHKTLTLTMPTGGSVEGHVTLHGQPLAEVKLSVRGNSVHTDEDGHFLLDRLNQGVETLRLKFDKHGLTYDREVIVENGKTLRVDLDFGENDTALTGIAYRDGIPANDVWIKLRPSDNNPIQVTQEIRAQSDGSYTMYGLEAGNYILSARNAEYPYPYERFLPVTLRHNEINHFDLELNAGSTIFCNITNTPFIMIRQLYAIPSNVDIEKVIQESPNPYRSIQALKTASARAGQPEANTIELRGLEPGSYTLLLADTYALSTTRQGHITMPLEVEADTDYEIEIPMP